MSDAFHTLEQLTGVRVFDAASLAREPLEPPRILSGSPFRIFEAQKIVVHGQPGSLKTFLVLASAVAVAARGERVLVFVGEGSLFNLRERLAGLAKGVAGVDLASLGDLFRIADGACAISLPKVNETIADAVRQLRPSLVVIDPLASYFAGDENSADSVKAFLNSLRFITDAGAALILIHHDRKPGADGASDIRGSSVFKGWVDSMHAVRRASDASTDVVVRNSKERDAEVLAERGFRLHFDEAGVVRLESREATPPSTRQDGPASVLKVIVEAVEPLTLNQIRERAHVGGQRASLALHKLVAAGEIQQVTIGRGRGSERYTRPPASGTAEACSSDGRPSP